jgi:hypothetical protein
MAKVELERLSGKCSASVIVAYAPRYGEQKISHGSVRRRMAFHQPASSRTHRTRTSQAARTTGVGGTERGFDPAKKVEGRKRHLLVDTEGLVL